MSGDSQIKYYTFSGKGTDSRFDGQVPEITMQVKTTLTSYDGIDNKFLTVSLANSTVSASSTGDMKHNSKSHRGWFTDLVKVCMSTDGIGDNKLVLEQDIPTTTSESTSYSTGETLGISVSDGTMGVLPIFNIGVSESSSSSVSQTVSDFSVANNSADNAVEHWYQLSSTPNGVYTGPKSLTKEKKNSLGIETDYYLSEVTVADGSAISNLPLTSQAIFRTPRGDYNELISLRVMIYHRLQSVSAKFKKSKDIFKVGKEKLSYYEEEDEPIYDVWKNITIDFSDVRNPVV